MLLAVQMVVDEAADGVSGFEISFTFKPGNPYFKSSNLVRHVSYTHSGALVVEVSPKVDVTHEGVCGVLVGGFHLFVGILYVHRCSHINC